MHFHLKKNDIKIYNKMFSVLLGEDIKSDFTKTRFEMKDTNI